METVPKYAPMLMEAISAHAPLVISLSLILPAMVGIMKIVL